MRRMVVDWANLEDFPLSLVLDKLEEHIDHVRFGVVCKNWLSIAKLNHQNHQFRVNIPPMVMIVEKESFKSKRISLYSILSQKHYIQFPSIKFQVTRGTSFGWLSFVHDNGDITLLNPFKYTSIPPISLPPLDPSPSKSLCKVTLSADPITSPNDYDIAAIYDYEHLALKRPNQPFWIPILNNPTSRVFSFSDVVFHKGLIVAEDHGTNIVSFKLNNNPPPDDLYDPNFTYYEKLATTRYDIPAQDYGGSIYLVKSLHGDLWLVRRYEIIPYKFSYTIDVYKLELDVQSGKLVQINKLESLEDNILFVGFCGHSFSVPASCLSNFKKDSIFFLCGSFLENLGMGIYNVKDGSCQRLSLPLSSELMQYSWILPQFQWD